MQSTSLGEMYNKYLIQLYAEDQELVQKSITIALREVQNRPTPETYDWLAWAYYNNGEMDKAFTISNNHVYKRSHEPAILYHTAVIFAAAGKKGEAKMLLEDCLESKFELGPITINKVHENMKKLETNEF